MTEHGVGFWALAVLASMLVGMSKGGLPVVGMLGVPVLALVLPPVMAAGVLLPVFVVSDMFGLWAYRHAFDRRVVAILAAGATLGVALGGATASSVPEWIVTLLIGLIGASFAASMLLRRAATPVARPARTGSGLFWGLLTGFTSFVSHAGAPPYQVYVQPLGLPKAVFAGTTTVLFAYVNAIKLIPYYLLGQLSGENLHIAAVLLLPAAAAVFLGVKLVKIIPTALFYRLVTWALLLISLRLIWQGLLG
ncbi:membrane protein [Haematobacter missouriensis]|nr:membrane protein [Haematobacter missouriensis]